MTSWPLTGLKGFLADRLLLYELCELCHQFPGAGTPSQYLGLNRHFSPWVCAEIDKGLAQFRIWYMGRMEKQVKAGKHKLRPAYKTIAEVIGIVEDQRRGGWGSGAKIASKGEEYKEAVLQAVRDGKPIPDVQEWLLEQEEDLDEEVPFDELELPPGV